jgi:hypothetical protein
MCFYAEAFKLAHTIARNCGTRARCAASSAAALFYDLPSAETLAQKECNDRVMRFLYLGEQLPQSQVHKRCCWKI